MVESFAVKEDFDAAVESIMRELGSKVCRPAGCPRARAAAVRARPPTVVDLESALVRIPNLSAALRAASSNLKRQIFDPFELRIV